MNTPLIKKGFEIGYKRCSKYIWHACIDCGKERWVRLRGNIPQHPRCRSCSRRGLLNGYWKGGEYIKRGYVFIRKPEHPRAYSSYVKRAVLVLEEKLGRYLLSGCGSHHINGIKTDDRPENLEELTRSEHMSLHRKSKKSR